jgi:RNA polymerase sigma-70 factor, ECF subfamily
MRSGRSVSKWLGDGRMRPLAPMGPVPAVAELSLEAIYRRHAADVLRWAARLLGPSGDPDDVVHDVFLVVQRRLADFRGEARITTWLHEITVRTSLAHRRQRQRWRWLRSGTAPEGSPRMAWLARFGPEPTDVVDPQAALERRRDTEAFYSLLDRIDDKYRTVLILHDLEALPVEAIAGLTGASISNVWARLSRGRKKFHRLYEAQRRRQSP